MYSVGNFLQLLTSASAWHIYEKLWSTLAHTGIAFIPLIVLIVSGLRAALANGPSHLWGVNALNMVEWRLYCAFAVILLAVVPSVGLHQNEVVYAQSECVITRADVARQSQLLRSGDQTQFDEVRLDGEVVRVPLWWWFINNLGQGITAVAINTLPCVVNVRRLVVELEDTRVKNPTLREETTRFQRECWRVAYGRSLQRPALGTPDERDTDSRSYETDTTWAGSNYFLSTPGFYNDIYPDKAVASFAYDANRDAAFASVERATDGGWPNCAQWWSDETQGLRARLLDSVPESLLARWFHRFKRDAHADDHLLYTMLDTYQKTGARVVSDDFTEANFLSKATDTGSKLLGLYAATSSAPTIAAVFNVLRDIAPILHSIVMLVLVVALPFVLMAGVYSPGRTLRLSLVFLSILFWGFLFKLVFWIDTTLGDALFYQGWGVGGVLDSLRWVFNSVMFSLYLSIPILFTRWASAVGNDFGANVGASLDTLGSWQILTNRNPTASGTSQMPTTKR